MTSWQIGRTGAALGAALAITLGACGRGDRGRAADTSMVGGNATGATTGAATDTGMMGGGAATATPGTMSDEQIMSHVGGANGIEIATGKIASDKATHADVKRFAREMVTDHQKLQAAADSLATRLNITPQATATDSMTKALADARTMLTNEKKGAGFDRAYMEMQVQAHENTLNLLNQASTATQNAEVRTTIQDAIPVVQRHLDQARRIMNGLGSATDTTMRRPAAESGARRPAADSAARRP
ncbi:MAG TPA: DUF4142 domain-containing protein [Gemmatimonadaceae bacterium]|nr:DUF4142 domain-containing protein [Gemmatimonadaceae bacterium]